MAAVAASRNISPASQVAMALTLAPVREIDTRGRRAPSIIESKETARESTLQTGASNGAQLQLAAGINAPCERNFAPGTENC